MKLDERNIFLLDGTGAVLSALSTGLLLPFFSTWIGLSRDTLYFLGVLALFLALYSLSCYRFLKRLRRSFLLAIILANIFYSIFTLGIVFLTKELTKLGQGYFILEVFIILCIVFLEINIYRKGIYSSS